MPQPQPRQVRQLIKAHGDPALARRMAWATCERLGDYPARDRIEILSFWTEACEVATRLGFRRESS
jgi:hypothetical protein